MCSILVWKNCSHWSIAWSLTFCSFCWIPNYVSIRRRFKSDKLVLSFQFQNIKQAGDRIFSCAYVCQKLSWCGIIVQSYCTVTIRRVQFLRLSFMVPTVRDSALFLRQTRTVFELRSRRSSMTERKSSVCWQSNSWNVKLATASRS